MTTDNAAPTTKPAAKKKAPAKRKPTRAELAEEARAERITEAATELDAFEETLTQREWLLVCNKLDRNRQQISSDGSLRLLALGWVKEKREHGGASWDRLLDMTDEEILVLHGFPVGDDTDDDETPEA